jgi:hypothetical protein
MLPGQDGKARLVRLELHVLVNGPGSAPRIQERLVMQDPERNRIVYVTADSSQWIVIDVPFGLITPPTIELHRPLVGAVMFYHASGHRLRVPAEAEPASE